MHITKLEVIPVTVPMIAPIRWAWGVRCAITRNILRLWTDSGICGIAESMGGSHVRDLITQLGSRVEGMSIWQLTDLLREGELLPYFHGYAGNAAVAAVEMAMLDAQGKAVDLPLHALLGGKTRNTIPTSAYVFYRSRGDDEGGESTPDAIADYCLQLRDKFGFTVYKLKGGVFPPQHELDTLVAMKEALGETAVLRIDPNGVWSLQTAVQLLPALEDVGLEYLEDPCFSMHEMAEINSSTRILTATNMSVVSIEDLPLAYNHRAVDIVLADLHKWGGIQATRRLVDVCETLHFGVSMHSGVELGIATAANLHVAAAMPQIRFAIDSHYHHQADDIIAGGRFEYQGGGMKVPDGPGLGVTIDEQKLERFHRAYLDYGVAPGIGNDTAATMPATRTKW